QRGARMAVGLGGGQPWREPPAPPTPLRVVPADPGDEEAATTPTQRPAASGPVRLVPSAAEPAEPEAPEQAGVRLVPAAPAESEEAETAAAAPDDNAPAADAEEAPESGAPSDAAPVEPESAGVEPGAVASAAPLLAMGAAAAGVGSQVPDPVPGDAESASHAAAPGEDATEPGSEGAALPVEGGPESQAEIADPAAPGTKAGPAVNRDAVWLAPEVAGQGVAETGPAPSVNGAAVGVGPEPEAPDESGVDSEPAAAESVPSVNGAAVGADSEADDEQPGVVEPGANATPAVNTGAVWVAPEAVPAEPEAENPAPESGGGGGAVVGGLTAAALGGAALAAGAARVRGAEVDGVPASAVPERFAEEAGAPIEQDAPRRGRQTPDERAAEQAAADLALLRTFGVADRELSPESTPVIAMERPADEQQDGRAGAAQPVRYRVVRRDGTVVSGATITLLDDRGGDVAAGAADAEGRGEVLAPGPGGYVLVSTAAGHQPGAVAITVGGAATETDVLIARSASVTGAVRAEDGPVAGARVTLVQDGEAVDAVDTGADGTYRIKDIGAGEYGLSVAAPGREPVTAVLEVPEEAEVRHDVELRPAAPIADSDMVDDDALTGLR
ncbi:carboxypeptidase-like regulatory domain-containing protein, partial [Pseudonocardia zijingensis]